MNAILRSLLRKPSYLIISVTVLSVSIAAQMGIVAVVDATLVRPPSGRSPENLVFVRSSLPEGIVAFPDFIDLRDKSSAFAGTFAYTNFANTGLAIGADSLLATCGVVSGEFFPTLGASPDRGRLLAGSDDSPGADRVAVVSAELAGDWKLEVGSIIKVDTVPFAVVGILPSGFRGVDRSVRPDIWITCGQVGAVSSMGGQQLLTNRNIQWVRVGGRLKSGVAVARARAELNVIAAELQKAYPVVNLGMGLALDSFSRFRFLEDDSARTLLLVSGIIWFLFALAFANFFALTLLRIFVRRRELAIKLALGARRSDIGKWLLGELALVSTLALAFGYGLGRALLHLLRLDPNIGRVVATAGVAIDFRSMLVVALSVLGGAGIAWLLALRQACRVDLLSAIKETSLAPRRQIVVGGLYALQFAIALFLLSVATSFVGTLREVGARKLPFRTENLLLADVSLRSLGLKGDGGRVFVDALLAAVRKTPGVIAAGASSRPIMSQTGWTNLIVNERDPSLDADKSFAVRLDVTPGFWEATGIPIHLGRVFTDADVARKAPLAVVNEAAVRRFWRNQNPLGQTFRAWPGGPRFEIVGVVADVPFAHSPKVDPLIYLESAQRSNFSMTLHIAVGRDSAAIRRDLGRQLASVWTSPHPPALRPVQQQIALASADLATMVRIVLWVAAFATLVTGCGLYFFSAYTASQTIKDAAIRLALGGDRSDVIAAHLRRYRFAILAGLGLGALLLAGAGPALARFDSAVGAPTWDCVALAAVPLLAIALVGLCMPLRKIGGLNVYRTLTLSD